MGSGVMAAWLLGAAVFVVIAVAGALVSEEALAQSTRLSRWMVRRAAHGLPAPARERYQEEWLAELEASSGGPISHLCFAASLLISWRRVAAEVAPTLAEMTGGDIYEVQTVPEASDIAALILQIATQQADRLIEEAKADRDRRILRRRRTSLDRSDMPRQIQVVFPDGASSAARKLLEIATRNATELVDEAGNEASKIRAERRHRTH